VRQDLLRLRADLLNEDYPDKEPFFCSCDPAGIDASLVPDRLPFLDIYGYDFDEADIRVLLDNGDNMLLDVSNELDDPSHYQLTLNLGSNGVPITTASERIIIIWDGEVQHSVGISQPDPGDPELPSCVWLDYVSEETSYARCPSGFAVKGLNCSGDYCDNKELYCCPYYHTNDTEAENSYSSWFSEENNGSYQTGSKFISGLGCKGDYCDNIRVRILDTPKLSNDGQCFNMPQISDGSNSESKCPEGYLGAGLSCSGNWCDNISLRCCRYSTD
jgi:hypothetical protein